MPVNETNTLLMMELLSLEHKLTGYQIEVGLTRNDGYAKCVLTIDEYTYTQLNLLWPFNKGRVRLSLYPKWDPFRNVHYSTLVKMNSPFSETLYFACSEYYVSQLHQLKQLENPHTEDALVGLQELPAAEPIQLTYGQSKPRFGRIALRCIMFSVLLIFMSLRWDANLLTEHVQALEEPAAVNVAGDNGVNLFPTLVRTASAQPTEPPKEKISLENEILLDANQFEYTLPDGYVALSFDDGPSEYTQQIIDILVEHNVAATFFFIGENALQYPQKVKYASDHGMSIGNHSWNHSEMTGNTDAENQVDLAKANQALEQTLQSPITIFRPPYGSIDGNLAKLVRDEQMKVLLWNRDPEDWKGKTPEGIVQYFHDTNPSGGIYLLHERKNTLEALPKIIKYLQGKNLKFAIFK